MNEPLLILSSTAEPAARNMAVDEALLSSARELATPVLRFYGWTEPAASFGYFQRYMEVEAITPLRPLVRRPTGGGIVPHDADWTYSLAFPAGHAWHSLKAIESYRRVHEWVRMAFEKTGVEAALAPCCLKTAPGQCFMGYEQFDVLLRGRKIAGAAQRRNREGLLIQGSVQPPPGVARSSWEAAMVEIANLEGYSCREFRPDIAFWERVSELEQAKYSQPSYNRKR